MPYVFAFEEGSKEQKYLLGGKGANLAEMTKLGLPVPPGFTITTDACKAYMAADDTIPAGLMDEVADALAALEAKMGKRLGDATDPLLVSVRSGAAFSMPGMMDTVLNLGLNDVSVGGLAQQTGNPRFAYDSYRRFVQMFAKIVLDVDGAKFEHALEELRKDRGVETDPELSADDLQGLADRFKAIVLAEAGIEFPQDPKEQLELAIEAVFRSWNSERAGIYRKMEKIADDLGTAVNVQTMVFGNKGDDSGTGVAFTRDPATGENRAYGDFLKNAQGEDVVAGIRTTEPLDAMGNEFPECHQQLLGLMQTLQSHYRDMCDIEFTIEQGRLFLLQTRVGKRTAVAALRMAVEMKEEGLIDQREAVLRVQPAQLDQLLHPQFDPEAKYTAITKGLNASPGAAVGKVYFTADDAEAHHEAGEHVILVRPETSPDDLHGMIAAEGILTSRGGLVSHAAVVARGMGTPAVCGANELHIDVDGRNVEVNGTVINEGDVISINGTTGEVVIGLGAGGHPRPRRSVRDPSRVGRRLPPHEGAHQRRPTARRTGGAPVRRRGHRPLPHRAHVPGRPPAAGAAVHPRRRIPPRRRTRSTSSRSCSAPTSRASSRRWTVCPSPSACSTRRCTSSSPTSRSCSCATPRASSTHEGRRLLAVAQLWREANPMLGTRGCRLGIIKPGLYRMQAKAIIEAAVARKAAGGDPHVEIMIPLIVSRARARAAQRLGARGRDRHLRRGRRPDVDYLVGTMIETPRAALVADEIAEVAEFFSFGTNDLTQMTFGFSRDDVEGRFMSEYLEHKLLRANPFETLDQEGVGQLVRLGVERGRATRPGIKLGICGEHGGDPASVEFCEQVGLDYVSCSPYRVPIARLAAAHASLGHDGPGSTA